MDGLARRSDRHGFAKAPWPLGESSVRITRSVVLGFLVCTLAARAESPLAAQSDAGIANKPGAGAPASPSPKPASDLSRAEAVECSKAADLGRVIYTLDHPTLTPSPSRVVLRDGERFTVKVARTFPQLFVYKLYRQRRPPDKAGPESGDTTDVCLTDHHEKQFGGYTLVIQTASGQPVTGYPAEVVVNIPVETHEWKYEFAGAFVGNRLRDHVYYASKEAQADGTTADIVRELADEERDWAKLGTAAFVHTTPPSWPVSLSFGLGIADGNKPTYFLGPGLRLGDQGFLSAGIAVGAVNRLPANLKIGDPLTDSNALTALRPRNTPAAFVALAFSFLSAKDRLVKPFAPTDAAAASPAPKPTPKPDPAPKPPQTDPGGP